MKIFRIDDIGASAKYYNQHGQKIFRYKGTPFFYFPLADVWFFKRIWPFKKWAPYEELTREEWISFLEIFQKYDIKPIIAITATWVERTGEIIPFPQKFPDEARVLKQALQNKQIVIANHGLTHCVVSQHAPLFWGSNRKYFREFWDWIPAEIHNEHIEKSQKILEEFFEQPIEIFVPPGNIWSIKTYRALRKTNIKKVLCNRYMIDSDESLDGMEFIDDREGYFNFHDRELKLYGKKWLIKKITELYDRRT